ncbi:MAG TPA: acylphosphatase [Candidatus Omnitrophota bacterium]|nr:acylphosphatase [Candidatus Omnitrophota bacterium]
MTAKPFNGRSQRKHFIYDGRVQGVGFRFTFERIARDTGVNGYVRNLPDGTVEAVCEASEDRLKILAEKVDAAMSAYIRSCRVEQKEATGEFRDFRISF